MAIVLFILQAAWQQRVAYEIEAALDTAERVLAASADVTYQNNAPRALDTIYFYLHAEAFRNGSARGASQAGKGKEKAGNEGRAGISTGAREGIVVDRVRAQGQDLEFGITETIMAVVLAGSLWPGDSVALTIDYSLQVPEGIDGFGYWPGRYEMTYWYPRVCVFDDAGWHLEPFDPRRGTYAEFGRYDIMLDLPAGYVIAATGARVGSDRSAHGVEGMARDGRQRVRFTAGNVTDFVWIADQEFGVEVRTCGQVEVSVYFRPDHGSQARNAGQYAVDAIERFSRWFGACPYTGISIVEGAQAQDRSWPQLIVVRMDEDRQTRIFEAQVAEAIAGQWFDSGLGVDGHNDAWLGQGLAAYAAIRYMEDKYGPAPSLINIPLLPPLSLEYYHRLHYYLVQTNRLESPLSAPVDGDGDPPVVRVNRTRSKPALFFRSLESAYGQERFDAMLRKYLQASAFAHAGPADLIDACRVLSQGDPGPLFDGFIRTTEHSDWAVKGVRGNTVEIVNRGRLRLPVRVVIRTGEREHAFLLDGREESYQIELERAAGDVTAVAIDPSARTLDPDQWNNYWPRRVAIRPVWGFEWPSFTTYQILWSPYLWYNHYDGVKAGLYVFGDKFADFDYVKGGYQITGGYVRGFGSDRDYPMLNYQTPLLFEDGLRVRMRFSGSRSQGGDHVSLGFVSQLGRPFVPAPQIEITNMLAYDGLFTYAGVDSLDWELGKNVALDNHFRFRHAGLDVDARLALALRALGSDWQYLKSAFEVKRTLRAGVPVAVRLFVGKIFGTAPSHEQFFLSGALRTNWLGNLLFGQSGPYSPQERFHVLGDGNMVGYQTRHIKASQMYALNLELPARALVRVFTDVGYHERFVFDAGLRLVIGSETIPALVIPGFNLSFNVPLYTYLAGESWRLCWSFSL